MYLLIVDGSFVIIFDSTKYPSPPPLNKIQISVKIKNNWASGSDLLSFLELQLSVIVRTFNITTFLLYQYFHNPSFMEYLSANQASTRFK